MKIINPSYADPMATFVAANKAAVLAYLQSKPGQAFFTSDELRTQFPALASNLTDGVVEEICKAIGARVEL